jgi:hypothetical protein
MSSKGRFRAVYTRERMILYAVLMLASWR